jgi:hypothetical protein
VAACRTNEPSDTQPAESAVPSVLAGVCEPAWRIEAKRRATVDVIRDLADYTPELLPTAEAVDGA